MNQPITLLKTLEKNTYENVNKDCRYLVVFLISCDKNSFFAISMFWLNFYQIAYIAKLSFSLTTSPSFPGSARAESNTEPRIFANILHSK